MNGKLNVRDVYGHVCYASCSHMRTRHMGLPVPRTTLSANALQEEGYLGVRQGPPDERAYAQGAMSPLGGCVRRRKKGRNSMGCLFLFFFDNWYAKKFGWKYRRVRSIRQYC